MDNLKVNKVWVTPGGKVGASFQAGSNYGVTDEDIQRIHKGLLLKEWTSAKEQLETNKAVVCVSDLHSGALVSTIVDVKKTQEYNYSKLTEYLDIVVQEINNRKLSEVVLIMPGDIIESFTAFNHSDTWKNIETYQGDAIIIVHKILRDFFSRIINLKEVYMIEGNHDRMTAKKESNSRKGIVQVVAHFLNEQSEIPVHYHPWIDSFEYDGLNYIMTHGDVKPWKGKQNSRGKFLFKYGKQGIHNVIVTGHYHSYTILDSDLDYTHISCPSIFTGNYFSESIGYNTHPGFLIMKNTRTKPAIEYIPI
jgi:predicted phosphodiesterase